MNSLQSYPKDYQSNMAWRGKILSRAETDPVFQAEIVELFHRDILFAFNAFFFTLDVRRRPFQDQPFCTYPFQDEVILRLKETIDNGGDIVIEKSRDMGVSWIVILVFLWFWLSPTGGADFLLGSRIEDYVDKKGDMRTLFQKARYAYYRLPKWLRPRGFRKTIHDNYLKLVNPETGATLTGESNNPNFSTAGRYLAILFDEFAKWESTDEQAWTSAGDATPCRIAVSTPFGAAGQYYNLVFDSTTAKVRLHWSLHPRKAEDLYCVFPKDEIVGVELRSSWYDRECQRRRPQEIAQELDIDYLGAGNPVFKGAASKRLVYFSKLEKKPTAIYEVSLMTPTLKKLEVVRWEEGVLLVWEEPDRDKSYAVGVDIAEGIEGGDFSVIKVFCRETKSIVASYVSQIDEVSLAKVISAISRYYHNPWVGIETIGPGLATFDVCAEILDVPNLFMMPTYDSAKEAVSFRKGWRTSTSSRNALVGGLQEWLLDGAGWCDPRCVREMFSFVRGKTGKAEARPGAHDDEVIALGIAIQVDALAPTEMKVKKVERREDGLPVAVFAPPKREEKTVEELCYETALRVHKSPEDEEDEFLDDEDWNYDVVAEEMF